MPCASRRRGAATVLLALSLVAAATAPAGAGVVAASRTTSLDDVVVTGDTGAKPTIEFAAPYAAERTTRKVLTKGSGTKLARGAKVVFHFTLTDGRTGAELESSYGGGLVSTTLDAKTTLAGIVKGLIGTQVGSRVLIAMAPEDSKAANEAFKAQGVKMNDTLLLVVDVERVHDPLLRAKGAAVATVEGLPEVTLSKKGAPSVDIPATAAPNDLVAQPLITGTGAAVIAGQTVTVHYSGWIWSSGKQFDSSWVRKEPVDFPIGTGGVIQGWDRGLVGRTVGSQMLLVIPPEQGYGSAGNASAGIKGTDTLVFVVDILDAV